MSGRGCLLRNCALLVVLCAIVYAFFLDGPFLSDDIAIIAQNLHIRHLRDIGQFFTPHYWNQVHRGTKGVFRPLREVVFAFIYAGLGDNPFHYHLISLLFHMGNVLLLYWLARRILHDELAALLGAGLFAVHPVHLEAVLWAKSLGEILAALFAILAFLLFVRAVRQQGRPRATIAWGAGAAVLYAAALMCKESGLALSGLLLLYGLFTVPREQRRRAMMLAVPMLVIGLAYVLFQFSSSPLVSAAVGGMRGDPDEVLSLRPALMGKTYAVYHRLLLFPVQLCAQYHFVFPISYGGPEALVYLIGFVLLAAAIAVGIIFWRRGTYLLMWSAGFLVPAANIIPFKGRPIADQRLYVASMGFCLLFGLAGSRVWQLCAAQRRTRLLAALTIGVVFATMIGLALDRGRVWRDERLFWMDMLRKSPIQAEANYQVGEIYGNEGRNAEALTHASYCVQGNPEHALGYVLLGKCYGVIGEHEEAIQYFRKAITIDPELPDGHANMAIAYLKTNRPDQAVPELNEAIRLAPEEPWSYIILAIAYQAMGKYPESFEPLRMALALAPPNAPIYDALGVSFLQLRQPSQAARAFGRAVELEPKNCFYLTHLAQALVELNQSQQAVQVLQRALRVDPNYAPALEMLRDLRP